MAQVPVGNTKKSGGLTWQNLPELWRGLWRFLLRSFRVTNDRFVAQRKHAPRRGLLALIMALLIVGFVVLCSISPAYASNYNSSTTGFIVKQAILVAAGVGVFWVMSRVPLDFWRQHALKLLLFALALCLLLAVLGWTGAPLAFCTNGACRWYALPLGLTFQPAELLKLALLVFVSGFLALRIKRNEQADLLTTVLPVVLLLLLSLFIVVFVQKDLGTGLSIIGIVFCELVLAKSPPRVLLSIAGVLVAFGLLAVTVAPHRMERLLSYGADCTVIDPESNDWHICQSLMALGSGGLLGRGLGNSVEAFGWLPEAVNDSIFAILGETFGLWGTVGILALFFALLYQILKVASHIDNDFLRILVAGLFGWVATHVILNVGSMTGVIPLTGITLPFLSLGGTSLFFVMGACGIVYNISRYTAHKTINEREGGQDESFSSRRRLGRARHTSGRDL